MARKLSDRQTDEACELYVSGKTMQEVGDRFNVSRRTIGNMLRRQRVKPRQSESYLVSVARRGVKEWQVEVVMELYAQGLTCREIAARFGVSADSVLNCLHRNGVKGRKRRNYYSLNEAVFDQAERSELASYYVGLLLADGCVYMKGANTYCIDLSLKASDSATIDGFRQFLGATHPLRFCRKDGNTGVSSMCVFSFRSERVFTSLATYGVVPRKTGRAVVSECLAYSRHFWRGHIDGNGSLFIDRKGSPVINLCGSKGICVQFLDFARTLIPTKANVHSHGKNCHSASISCRKAVAVVNELYGNCQVAMQRKLDVANKIISIGRTKGWLSHS